MCTNQEAYMKKCYRVGICRGSLLIILVACVLVFGLTRIGWFNRPASIQEHQTQLINSAQIPLTFVENRGQWDEAIQFRVRHRGMVAFLQKDALTLKFEKRVSKDQVKGVAVNMTFVGTSDGVVLEAQELQSGVHNFFVGNDPSRWQSGVPGYGRVVYRGLYESVDLCLREEDGWLEYTVTVFKETESNPVVPW
jgi:hypothetical protein